MSDNYNMPQLIEITSDEQVENQEEKENKNDEVKEENHELTNPNKAVLFLINGLGVASKNSFNIDYQEIMPNMSMLMNNYLYTTLENINYNYKNGFRNFSLGNDLLPTYHRLEQDTDFSNNKTILSIAEDAINNRSKIHLFCFLDHDQVTSQVMKFVNALSPKGNYMIYIHIILRQKDLQGYDTVTPRIKKLEEAITLIQNVQIGIITGERTINSDLYYSIFAKENGEKWPDYSRKLNFEKANGTIPREMNPFYKTSGFKVAPYDIALFLNYEDVDCDQFIQKFRSVKLYTLFPMKAYKYAINIYEEIEPTLYFSKILEENNLHCLILTSEDRIPSINYNLCGLKETKSKNITYRSIHDKSINYRDLINENYNYFIFDYDLVNFKEIRKMKEFLMELDEKIDDVYNYCEQNNHRMFISSLYGIYKTFTVGIDKEVIVDYSKEVPAVIIDQDLPKSKFMFKYGTTFNLSNTIFNLLTKNENIPTSIRKRGLLSFFQD